MSPDGPALFLLPKGHHEDILAASVSVSHSSLVPTDKHEDACASHCVTQEAETAELPGLRSAWAVE